LTIKEKEGFDMEREIIRVLRTANGCGGTKGFFSFKTLYH
jgi:hypothetical protein